MLFGLNIYNSDGVIEHLIRDENLYFLEFIYYFFRWVENHCFLNGSKTVILYLS